MQLPTKSKTHWLNSEKPVILGVLLAFLSKSSLQLDFTGGKNGKTIWTESFYKTNFPLDGQTRQANSTSQPVNLPLLSTLVDIVDNAL